MRKLLLSLLAMAGMTFSAAAAEYAYTFTATPSGMSGKATAELTLGEATWTYTNGSSSTVTKDSSGRGIQIGTSKANASNVIFSTDFFNGKSITGITVTLAGNAGSVIYNVDGSAVNGEAGSSYSSTSGTTTTDVAWTAESAVACTSGLSIEIKPGSGKALFFKTITVTYETGPVTPAAVEKPVITTIEGEYGFTATITCATEGAKIYYNLEGEEPTAASDEYTGTPVEVWNTISAIAIKGDDKSAVATATVPQILDSFNGMIDFPAGTKVIVKGTISAIYQNGSYNYVKCGDSYMLIYGSLGKTLANGDTFSRLEGTVGDRNGLIAITNATIGEVSTGAAVEPVETELELVNTTVLNHYVTVKNVTVSAWNGKNATMTDADGNSVALYNQFNIDVAGKTGEGCDVTGFVGSYNGNLQFNPTFIKPAKETAATPEFSVAAGEVAEGTELTITCATEGAKIYYTTDGTEPTAESTEYISPIAIGADMTVKAIAVAEGMYDSAVASASYTVLPEGYASVSFNFASTTADDAVNNLLVTADANFAPEAKNTEDGKGNLNGKEFVNGIISMEVSLGGNTTNNGYPSWYDASAGVRMYQNNTITIGLTENGYKLLSIVFSQASGNTTWAASNSVNFGTLDSKTWTPKEGENITEVIFTFGGASRFNNVKVTYVEAPGVATGIEGITADENTPVEYYNLQGIRVANPAQGSVVIRRQGSHVSKVIVR